MEIEGKKALITGGCGGMGLAIAEMFLGKGLSVVLVDRQTQSADALLANYPKHLSTVAVDLIDLDACKAALEPLLGAQDAPDILVNAVGIGSPRQANGNAVPIAEHTVADWLRVMAINVDSVFYCTQLALPRMKARHYGRIINIVSMAPRVGGVNVGAAYVTSKAAMMGFTKALAHEVSRAGITVNAINPGKVSTPMISHLAASNAAFAETVPLGRLGMPADIAGCVEFLASRGADYLTGSAIEVNGGQYMGA